MRIAQVPDAVMWTAVDVQNQSSALRTMPVIPAESVWTTGALTPALLRIVQGLKDAWTTAVWNPLNVWKTWIVSADDTVMQGRADRPVVIIQTVLGRTPATSIMDGAYPPTQAVDWTMIACPARFPKMKTEVA